MQHERSWQIRGAPGVGAVVFLASDAGRYVNGGMLVVDGGFTINAGI